MAYIVPRSLEESACIEESGHVKYVSICTMDGKNMGYFLAGFRIRIIAEVEWLYQVLDNKKWITQTWAGRGYLKLLYVCCALIFNAFVDAWCHMKMYSCKLQCIV